VFSGADGSLLQSFFAFDATFTGGVRVASGNFNSDLNADIVTATGLGASQVIVYNGIDLTKITIVNAPPTPFGGGLYVAAGDLTGDGRADVITSGDRGAATLNTFNGTNGNAITSFAVFGGAFGGATVASADITGDGFADYIVGRNRLSSAVQVLSNANQAVVLDLAPFGGFRGGVFVG
jgi:hypothetical protein